MIIVKYLILTLLLQLRLLTYLRKGFIFVMNFTNAYLFKYSFWYSIWLTTFELVHTFYVVDWGWKPDVSVMTVEGVLLRIFVFMASLTSFPVFNFLAFSIVNTNRMAPMEIDIFQDIFLALATTPALITRLHNLPSGHKWRHRGCCCFNGCLIYLYKMVFIFDSTIQCEIDYIFKDFNSVLFAYLCIVQTWKNHKSMNGWHRH